MRSLDQGYSAEVDLIGRSSWDSLMLVFKDASYYQTWSFGAYHAGEDGMSHIILRKDGEAAGMAQLRIVRFPGLQIGIAFLSGGPVCIPKSGSCYGEHLRNMARALYNEYVVRRRYFLRIVPNVIDTAENSAFKWLLAEEGYSWSDRSGQTVLVDLSVSLAEIRKNMDRKWRQTLQSAERKSVCLIEGNSDDLCRMASEVIRQMKNRKQFLGGNQSEAIRAQKDLPESLKLRLAVCLVDDQPAATLGWETLGTVGLPLIAATGDLALRTGSSYLLWWKMVEYYKGRGFVAVDMGGVNRRRNPGGYYFKTHILGKRLKEQPRYIGQFDACKNRLSLAFFIALNKSREIYRDLLSMV